jgi:hypothetical protein
MGWIQTLNWRLRLIPWSLVILIALGIISNFWFQESATAAAWAQAWGSLLAIAAAIWISNDERRQVQRREKENTLAVIDACEAFVQSIKIIVDMDVEKYPDLDALEDSFELIHARRSHIMNFWAISGHHYKIAAYAKALSEIPVHRLDSPKAVSALLEMVIQISSPELFENVIDKYFEAPSLDVHYQETKATLDGYSVEEQKKVLSGVAAALNCVKRQNIERKLNYLKELMQTIRDELGD